MRISQSSALLFIVFLAINGIAFLIMAIDKARSRNNDAQRISEGMLFFLATLFGSFGVYAGMVLFRHKTQKWYFLVGIPLLMAQNSAFFYLIYLLLHNYL